MCGSGQLARWVTSAAPGAVRPFGSASRFLSGVLVSNVGPHRRRRLIAHGSLSHLSAASRLFSTRMRVLALRNGAVRMSPRQHDSASSGVLESALLADVHLANRHDVRAMDAVSAPVAVRQRHSRSVAPLLPGKKHPGHHWSGVLPRSRLVLPRLRFEPVKATAGSHVGVLLKHLGGRRHDRPGDQSDESPVRAKTADDGPVQGNL